MAPVNGYCTLAELKAYLTAYGTTLAVDAADDAVYEDIITDASRMIDAVCGRWFYSDTQTRYFSVPDSDECTDGRLLWLDEDLLTITTLTNGDATVITTTDYVLEPRNVSPKFAIKLLDVSDIFWEYDSDNSAEYVISVLGTWGYVDRTAVDPVSARIISNTRRACLEIAMHKVRERFGNNQTGSAQITAAGVVITPFGAMPKSAYEAIKAYIKRVA